MQSAKASVKRVLSIQSHVVSGYVGNKCAVLPLQLLGFDVDPIMSVQFSNHTGYPSFKGTVMSGSDLESIISGMESNGLLQHSHVLTGYIGSISFALSIANVLQRVKSRQPDVWYGAARCIASR
jgi:pyridoxine kinase